MTTDEMQSKYNHIVIGVIVGNVMFMAFYWGVFGTVDLVGSMGIGFGSGFSASVVSYMMSRDSESGPLSAMAEHPEFH